MKSDHSDSEASTVADGGAKLTPDTTGTPQEPEELEIEEIGMIAEYKNLYSGKEDKNGRFQWQTTIPKDVGTPAEDAKTQKYAIVVRHIKTFNDPRKVLSMHSIVVQSPLLKELLTEVLDGYPGVTVDLKRLEFSGQFEPLIHRWEKLINAINDLQKQWDSGQQDPQTTQKLEHAKLLRDLLMKEFADTIEASRDMKSKGVMTYAHLWTLFHPDSFVFCKQQGQERVLRLQSSSYGSDSSGHSVYWLKCQYVDWDGTNFGTVKQNLSIPGYQGTKVITRLSALPLDFHTNKEQVMARLITRGEKMEGLSGSHYRAYDGVGWCPGPRGEKQYRSVQGRVVIDTYGWNLYNPNLRVSVRQLPASGYESDEDDRYSEYSESEDEYDDGYDLQDGGIPADGLFGDEDGQGNRRRKLTDEQKMLCSPLVRGYALKEKLWLNFFVNSVHDISFDNRAFESLKLPSNQKDLILGFTSTQQRYRSQFDDVITGKGRGIIVLLCGPPGVGKTLTAESVAEEMKVPLYNMAAGDLGLDPRSVEVKLDEILNMCTRWNAILLLDEADVFLEERSLHELERNKLVSIFLRVLEYYGGIMFLTTNRVQTFDAAFQSRIHISIEYKELDSKARTAVWQNFLKQHNEAQEKAMKNPQPALPSAAKAQDASRSTIPVGIKGEGGEEFCQTLPHKITTKDVAKLASFELNGRQIKNFLKTAQLLANSKGEALSYAHVDAVLEMTQHLHNASREISMTKSSYYT